MSAAMQAGDETFARAVLKPSPPSLDYHCVKCGKPITNWSAKIDPVSTKLHLTAKCHGETVEFVLHLGMGGKLFG